MELKKDYLWCQKPPVNRPVACRWFLSMLRIFLHPYRRLNKPPVINWWKILTFLLIAMAFAALKISSFNYAISDENTYYLMGKEVAEGKIPYKDFFFSHPPLQILLFALLIKIFGFNFLILKATSTIAIVIAAFFIFKLINEKIGIKEGLLAALLFLFSYDTLRFSSYPTGVNLTVMFIVIGFYFLINNRPLAAGIFSGLAGITGIYSLIAIAVFAAFLLWKNRNGFLRFSAGFLAVFLTTNMVFLIITGPNYLTEVYFYHLMKPSEGIGKWDVIQRLITANALLWAAALMFIISEKKMKKEVFISIGVIMAYWIFFIASKKVFAYYMMLAFPFAALIGAYSIMSSNLKISRRAVFLIAALLMLISAYFAASGFSSYDYQDFKEAGEIAKYIRENSDKEEKIFGDESITPLLSMLSERKIAMDFLDSNSLRFKSGVTNANETIAGLKKELKFFIAYKVDVGAGKLSYGVITLPEFEKFTGENCNISKVFRSKWRDYTKEYYVYDCEQS